MTLSWRHLGGGRRHGTALARRGPPRSAVGGRILLALHGRQGWWDQARECHIPCSARTHTHARARACARTHTHTHTRAHTCCGKAKAAGSVQWTAPTRAPGTWHSPQRRAAPPSLLPSQSGPAASTYATHLMSGRRWPTCTAAAHNPPAIHSLALIRCCPIEGMVSSPGAILRSFGCVYTSRGLTKEMCNTQKDLPGWLYCKERKGA